MLTKAQLIKILFANTPNHDRYGKVLDAYQRKSAVPSAMVRAFSIGCLWMNPKPHATAWNGITSGLDEIFDIIKECDVLGRVYTICQSLDDLTMAHTDVDSWMNVDVPGLDGLHEDPLQCIIRLIGEDVAAPPWIVEENSPLAEEQGGSSSQPAHGGVCIAGSSEGRLDGSPGGEASSGESQ